ncbi:MAG TPA: VWA domain-containing protein [Acidimicrobiales bacterium]|nr:VWA domain-containing protein [Acidimicrobiales bacterium]
MTFRSPEMLALLLLVPVMVAAYVRTRRRRAQRAAALAEEGLVATPAPSRMRIRRHLPFALFVLALTSLLVGMARPHAEVTTPRREGTVILALDVSNSMRADDIKPSRLEAQKAAARAFVERQPSEVRVGVVAFGDGAVVVQAPTNSHPEIIKSIDRLTSQGGTSLGQALVTSLGAIAGKPVAIDFEALASDSAQVDIGYFGSATVVLFSDGEETSRPNPVAVAEVASVAGVRVHTIGVGTPQGAVVQVDGFNVATALDRELLEEVASVTDGSYHEAGDAEGLSRISESIDLRFKLVSEYSEVTGLFAAAGSVLMVLGALLSVLWFGRVV